LDLTIASSWHCTMKIQTTYAATFNPDRDAARGKIIGSTRWKDYKT
jgi:hypothetical protein